MVVLEHGVLKHFPGTGEIDHCGMLAEYNGNLLNLESATETSYAHEARQDGES